MNRLDQKYHYYAFISYNHRDERMAKWLQRQLEHYRLPSVARKEIGEDAKIRPVFRYAVNLSLGDLRRQVKEELDASKFLIVICSPNSAQPNIEGKHWVNDEATRFIETGREDDIIPVIVDGEPNVGGDRECFPPALRNREIAGANLSKGSRSERRRDFLKIVAKLLGILPDQLIRHTEEEEKRARFRSWLKLLPLAMLAAVGGSSPGIRPGLSRTTMPTMSTLMGCRRVYSHSRRPKSRTVTSTTVSNTGVSNLETRLMPTLRTGVFGRFLACGGNLCALCNDGFAEVRTVYDQYGEKKEVVFCDEKGKTIVREQEAKDGGPIP